MKKRTKAKEVFDLVNVFLRENLIPRNKVESLYRDGAPAMIGNQSDFVP